MRGVQTPFATLIAKENGEKKKKTSQWLISFTLKE